MDYVWNHTLQESDQGRPGKGRNEEQSSDEDEEEEEKPTLRRGQHLFSRSQPKSPRERDSSDDGDSKVDNVQREQNLVGVFVPFYVSPSYCRCHQDYVILWFTF